MLHAPAQQNWIYKRVELAIYMQFKLSTLTGQADLLTRETRQIVCYCIKLSEIY